MKIIFSGGIVNITNKTEVIKFRVDREVYSKIKKIAEKEDRKYSAQINRILKDWAKKINMETGFTSSNKQSNQSVNKPD